MKVWAISDLHLGFSTGKWMDVFGDHWKDHHVKVADAWNECVRPEDLVLLPGDFSWGMRANEVAIDFEWLAALPGRKVLIKGNHDYWWPSSHKKLEALLPRGVYAIKKRSVVVDGVPIVGVRGGDFLPRENGSIEDTEAALRRERRELALSIESLGDATAHQHRPVALFHYPPFPIERSESFFTRMLEDAGCSICVYGHLHTENEWKRVFRGKKNGIQYHLVSCDALGFRPLLVDEL